MLTELQAKALTEVEHHMKGNPITGAKLANLIGLKPRSNGKAGADMRSVIHALRVKGYPVCASGKGYWYAETKKELEEYCDQLTARIRDQQEALSGLKNSGEQVGRKHYETIEELFVDPGAPPRQFVYEVTNPMDRSQKKMLQVAAGDVEKLLSKYPDAVKMN